ncbi:unnamed protein product [Phytophthora fragariaefolia]|uniref:Unnamed protein product n=1 Tax=Phytophthora fragariaefolia TaxID=1490495 RepID=A0A9W6WZJ7_9STRA|nr:unnamed protein product [Phytophthora fragariaefolia]
MHPGRLRSLRRPDDRFAGTDRIFRTTKKLMEVAARKKDPDLYKVMTQQIKHNASFTTLQQSAWDRRQLDLQELIFSSVCTDMGQQLMDMEDGPTMWKYLCDRYEGTANDQTRAMTKRQLYAQLETGKCKQNCKIEGHLNYMCRLKGKHKTVGMTVDDAVFSGMLVSSLPSNERFARLRGFVDAGMDCVDKPEKVVAVAVTFDKANQADERTRKGWIRERKFERTRKVSIVFCTDHLKAGCPDKAKKQSGDEEKRAPRGNCTLRQDGHTSPAVALSDEGIVAEDVVTGITMLTRMEEYRGDDPRDDQEAEATEVVQEADHQETMDAMEAGCSWWYFETASNSHVTGARSHFITFTENTTNARNVRGLSPSIISRIPGRALVNEVNGEDVTMYIDNLFYVPDAEYGLFSPGMAYGQGFEFDFNQASRSFVISWEGRRVVVAKLHEATWGFQASNTSRYAAVGPEDQPLTNYTIAEGVGTLQ